MLPRGLTESQLRAAVAESTSWRGVLRQFGLTSPRVGRQLRSACDALGITYGHFYGMGRADRNELCLVLARSASWAEVFAALGYAADSGSARSLVRRQATDLGIDISHLESQALSNTAAGPFAGTSDVRYLRRAAAFLVAAKCTL